MDDKPRWHELIERAKNFHGDFETFQKQALENKIFFENLYYFKENIVVDLDKLRGLSEKQIMKMVFERIFNFITRGNDDFSIFEKDMVIHDDVFEACYFITLCMFIHDTKKIKGMSLRKFLYENSPMQYNVKGTKNYFDFYKKDREHYDNYGFQNIKNEETAIRKMRNRLLSNRAVYDEHPEWSGIRKNSEHEWSFYYILQNFGHESESIYKRIGRLHNGINEVLNPPKDEAYVKRVESAFFTFSHELKKIGYDLDNGIKEALNSPKDKYYIRRVDSACKKVLSKSKKADYTLYENISKTLAHPKDQDYIKRLVDAYIELLPKLKKIDYMEFLELQKKILIYICEDKRYIGMNIYRFEKSLRLYNITNEMKSLLECKNETEEDAILRKSVMLNDVTFPKLYQAFSGFEELNHTEIYVKVFMRLRDVVVSVGRLILDEFRENGYFGDDWEKLFLDTINEMTEKVFYAPDKIDYFTTPESQEKFIKILSAPALGMISLYSVLIIPKDLYDER